MQNILTGGNKKCSNECHGLQNGLFQYCFRKLAKYTTKIKTIAFPSAMILRESLFF